METELYNIDDILISERKRSINEAKVEEIAASIASIGLKQPITIRFISETEAPILVVGLHRLLAMKKLGHSQIETFVDYQGSDLNARMWEISENLHRSDLTVLERSQHIAEWVRLSIDRAEVDGEDQGFLVQLAPKPQGGRPEGGIRAAERELGFEHTEVQRAVTIATKLAPEAKNESIAQDLDDNQSALLAAAKEKTPQEQIKKLQEIGSKKRAQQTRITKPDDEISQEWRAKFNKLIAKASQPDLQWARERVDELVADRAPALRIVK